MINVIHFLLNEDCNWSCPYCIYSKIKNPKRSSIRKIDKHIPYIRKFIEENNIDEIYIGYAEVGLLDKYLLKYFLKKLDKKVIISTNGKFFDNKYHKDDLIRKYIKEIYWHVIDIPRDIYINDYQSDIKIKRGIVGENVIDIVSFLKSNDHIIFDYIDFDMSLECNKDFPSLQFLYNNVKYLKNVTEKCKENIFNGIKWESKLKHSQGVCYSLNSNCYIDLANEKLKRCLGRSHDSISLTYDNLKKKNTTMNRFLFKEGKAFCNTCIRLCRGQSVFSNLK